MEIWCPKLTTCSAFQRTDAAPPLTPYYVFVGGSIGGPNSKNKGTIMALINCSECGAEISDKAAVCPHCGAPVGQDKESKGSGVKQLTTTQGTSKSIKLQGAIAVTMIIVGICWMYTVGSVNPQADLTLPGAITAIGLVWYVANRIRRWWHHD